MRHRVLSLALTGLVVLATAATAFAQVAIITPTAANGRVDQIVGFAQTPGVPPVAPGTFVPQVTATDPTSAAMGTALVPYVQDLDAYFATRFGWRPSQPVTVVLYPDSTSLSSGLQGFTGGTLSADQLSQATSQPAALIMATQAIGQVPANSWVIAVNTNIDQAAQQFINSASQIGSVNASLVPTGTSTSFSISPDVVSNTGNNGMAMIQESLAYQYANVMMNDLAGANGPLWFRQGLPNSIAFAIVPGVPADSGLAETVARYQNVNNTLPTLGQIQDGWNTFLSAGGTSANLAQGIAFLSVRTLTNTLSGPKLVDFLKGLGAGQSFNSLLQSSTGFNLDTLNSQYQSLIPMP
jgi:hypothetical protein